MAQLFDIRKVVIGPKSFVAEVELAPSAPLLTSDDEQGTELVLGLMPELAEHACLGDSSSVFGEVVSSTELAHLLEHVTVELLARTDIAGDITSGKTVEVGERSYEITLSCPDDVLVAGALSSAVWILQWAYSGGGEPVPNVGATVSGLVGLVESLGDEEPVDDGAPLEEAPLDEAVDEGATTAFEAQPYGGPEGDVSLTEEDAVALGETTAFAPLSEEPRQDYPGQAPTEAGADPLPMAADPEGGHAGPAAIDVEAEASPEQGAPDDVPSPRSWDMGNYPRPHLVR